MASTQEAAKAAGGAKSHRVSVLNPSRPDLIDREIRVLINDAIQDALVKIDDLIAADHITKEEAADALAWHSDFSDAWEDHSA